MAKLLIAALLAAASFGTLADGGHRFGGGWTGRPDVQVQIGGAPQHRPGWEHRGDVHRRPDGQFRPDHPGRHEHQFRHEQQFRQEHQFRPDARPIEHDRYRQYQWYDSQHHRHWGDRSDHDRYYWNQRRNDRHHHDHHGWRHQRERLYGR